MKYKQAPPLKEMLDRIQVGYEEIVINWNEWETDCRKHAALNTLIQHGYTKVDDTAPLTEDMETYVLTCAPVKCDYWILRAKRDDNGDTTALLEEQLGTDYLVVYQMCFIDFTWKAALRFKSSERKLAFETFDNSPGTEYEV